MQHIESTNNCHTSGKIQAKGGMCCCSGKLSVNDRCGRIKSVKLLLTLIYVCTDFDITISKPLSPDCVVTEVNRQL